MNTQSLVAERNKDGIKVVVYSHHSPLNKYDTSYTVESFKNGIKQKYCSGTWSLSGAMLEMDNIYNIIANS